MLALGSLALQETPEVIEEFARRHGYSRLSNAHTVAALFADRYGVGQYLSCDLNGAADIVLDLSQPLPLQYRNAFASVLNGGTLEHVFDLRQVMQNIHDATSVGGVMLHSCPLTWLDHGFVNINPVLFHLMAEANAYEIVAEGYYFSPGTWPGQEQPVVTLLGVDATVPGANQTCQEMLAGRQIPALVMYLVALRKTCDAKFKVPIQVDG
jgi:SAM-dependent methyltransferase